MRDKHRIMFVCHGNICRSPIAEFVFLDMVRKSGKSDRFAVASSATSTEEIWNGVGNPIYPPAKEILKANRIPFSERRAVLLCRNDYEKYDMFVGMDSANLRNMYRIFGSDPQKKIKKLMDFTGKDRDVSDPWYSRRFDVAYNDIYEGCGALLEYLDSEEE